ncbi:MAG: mandelate racemase/muconate lactonizing enzyme family protein [SAR202 cluster bacterium]|nr:mandelate racemase/muconate lactonizing enzyme family protein [SAR202 cluster bacterium]
MKITSVTTLMLRNPEAPHVQDGTIPPLKPGAKGRSQLFVEIGTDDGVTGLGMNSGVPATRTVIDTAFRDLLIGQDPFDSEKLWNDMYWRVRGYGRKGVAIEAIAAVDIALWDLKARAVGKPLHKLLGGMREEVPGYGSGGWTHYTERQLVAEMARYVEEGFPRIKMKVGKDFGQSEREDIARVRAVRKAVGDDIEIYVDANWAYTSRQAVRMSKAFEEFNVGWFEEPTTAEDIDGLRAIREATTIPVASGELEHTKFGFKELISRGGCDIAQMDVGRVGGVTEWIKTAHFAAAYNLPVAPHGFPQLHVVLGAATPNFKVLEFGRPEHTLDFWFVDYPRPVKGLLRPFDRPGHGLQLNPATVKKYAV